MRRALSIAAAVALLGVAVSAHAHHAIYATVDINNPIEARAILTKIDWINPHTWMHFDIVALDGRIQKDVMIESLGITALRQVGINSKSALKVGEVYQITYYPQRDGTPGGFMKAMTLPDGRVFDIRTTDPTAASGPRTN
jgi:hypothetical protein